MTAGLSRYVATVETAKHRTFQFLDAAVLPDHRLICWGTDDATTLAVLSSTVHQGWALATGGTLEDCPVYNKTRCFETFPFPTLTTEQRSTLTDLGERLDAHRKRQQAAHPGLTLTGCYNVLAKLRSGETLNAKEKLIHEQGLCSLLKELHDAIDRAVLSAYGWDDLLPMLECVNGNAPGARDAAQHALTAELLTRLAALNAERAAEEARGLIRWLRPDYQNPQATPVQASADLSAPATTPAATASAERQPWPEALPQQVAAVASVLATTRAGLDAEAIAAHFKGKGPWKKRLPQILDTLHALGRIRKSPNGLVTAI